MYIYILTNTHNNKKYVGKTHLPKWLFKTLLYDILDDKNIIMIYCKKTG